jgi:ribosome-binding protein aMBF1 (putative translation factor)
MLEENLISKVLMPQTEVLFFCEADRSAPVLEWLDAMKQKKTTIALDILNRRHPPSAEDVKMRMAFRQQTEVAELIHQARTDAGLSQRELAQRVGTTASVICRLEDGDYDGHSMAMLRRIAEALGQRIEMRFVRAALQELHA